MKVFYIKGEVVPRWILAARNKKNQHNYRFGVDCEVRGKKVIGLKKCKSRIVIGKSEPARRAQPMYKWNFYARNVHITGKWSDFSITINKYT